MGAGWGPLLLGSVGDGGLGDFPVHAGVDADDLEVGVELGHGLLVGVVRGAAGDGEEGGAVGSGGGGGEVGGVLGDDPLKV